MLKGQGKGRSLTSVHNNCMCTQDTWKDSDNVVPSVYGGLKVHIFVIRLGFRVPHLKLLSKNISLYHNLLINDGELADNVYIIWLLKMTHPIDFLDSSNSAQILREN